MLFGERAERGDVEQGTRNRADPVLPAAVTTHVEFKDLETGTVVVGVDTAKAGWFHHTDPAHEPGPRGAEPQRVMKPVEIAVEKTFRQREDQVGGTIGVVDEPVHLRFPDEHRPRQVVVAEGGQVRAPRPVEINTQQRGAHAGQLVVEQLRHTISHAYGSLS